MAPTIVKVLTCGNHPSVNGGITSVISQILSFDWNKSNVEMKFHPTYYGGNVIRKTLGFVIAYFLLLLRLTFDRPDIVHIHMSYKGSFYRANMINKLCKKRGVKTIIHLHGSTFKDWFDSINDNEKKKVKALFETTDATIVLGNKWNNVVKEIAPNAHTLILNNAVHISEKNISWNDNCFKILFMGVLIQRKGVVDLLEAVNNLKSTGQFDNKKLVIAGVGKEEEALKKYVIENQLEDYIDFAGWVSGNDKEKYYLDSQCFILPSYNEGLPVAILEAMSYGLPIIATDVGDVSQAVNNHINGFLIKPGSIKEIEASIIELSSSKEKFEMMSKKSKEIAIDSFSEVYFFEKLEELYKTI